MSFLKPDPKRNQTIWKIGKWDFYTNIPEAITDLKVINEAKAIVDWAIPQAFGPHGTHYYSFVTREYVLNLILNYYRIHGRFPQGDVYVADKWCWQHPVTKNYGASPFSFWWAGVFKIAKRPKEYPDGHWVSLPSLEGIEDRENLSTINGRNRENRKAQWRAKYSKEYHWLQTNYGKSKFARATYRCLDAVGYLTKEQLKDLREEINFYE